MAVIREVEDRDLMHFTRYAVDFLHAVKDEQEGQLSGDVLRERKFWAADQFTNAAPEQKLIAAEVEGRLIGYGLAVINSIAAEERKGRIEELYVDEFYRREGIGTQLCRSLLDWMQAQDVEDIQVEWQGAGHGGQEFFQSFGFIPVRTVYQYPEHLLGRGSEE